MQKGDVRLSPLVNFTGTKAAIEAIADPVEGMIAQATDSPYEIGRYANGAWVWGGGGGGITDAPNDGMFYGRSNAAWNMPMLENVLGLDPNMITNGSFVTDSDWTKGTGWTIDTGIEAAVATNVTTGILEATSPPLVAGIKYLIQYTIIVTSGDIAIGDSDATGVTRTTSGTYYEEWTSYDGTFWFISPSSDFTGEIHDVSARQITYWTTAQVKDLTGGGATILHTHAGVVSDGDKGDITVSDSGATWTIDAKAVTLAKRDDMATASLIYRKTALAGAPEVNTLATLKTDLGLGGIDLATTTTDVKEPTGWLDPDAVAAAMTYDSTTQKISISGTHSYYWRGIKTSVTNFVSSAHDNTVGHQYYLSSGDGSIFTWATDTVWTFDVIMVAFVNYQTAVKFALAESHGLMQWQVHETLHQTIGTYKESGGTLDPATYTLLSTTAAHRRPNVIAAHLHDEDVDSVLAALTSATYNKFYLSSTGTNNFTGLTADIVPLLTNNPYYNLFSTPNWTQVLMANNSYMCVWLAAMPVTQDAASQAYRYIWIQGQANGNLASQEALQPASLNLGTLSTESSEIVFLVKIIIRYTGGNWDLYSITNLTGSKFSQVGASAGNYLSAVTTNGSLTGDGTTGNPLSASSGATTATAAGTTTLTVSSYTIQEFTGATTQTVVLPVVTTLRLGHQFRFINNSSGLVTVNSSGGNLVTTVAAGATVFVSCILITGTTAASWSVFNAAATYSTLASMSAANAALLVGGASTLLHGHNLADGQMLNGKIVPSVSSNNLTLALKGMDGNDPSATNPVLVRIGNTIRSITAALSVTKNAGTNWFGSGATILATKEIDYFAYLGYNTTDGVVLGFSRVPYASLYSDFSATTTSETYAAISTTTNAAAGDNYVNIGRFAATLSATASFNWSVPTFTAANLKQCPTYETRLLTWAPVITSDTGTPTTVTNTCKYKLMGSDIEYLVSVTVVDKGTANGNINLTYPFLVAITQSGAGRENAATGASVGAKITSTVIGLSKYDTTTLWVNTYNPSVLIRAVL
jgi:hypothetical protein